MTTCPFCKGTGFVRDVLMRNEVCKHCIKENNRGEEVSMRDRVSGDDEEDSSEGSKSHIEGGG